MRTLVCTAGMLLLLVSVVFCPLSTLAQQANSRISGTITDEGASVLPGARIELQREQVVFASTVTDGQGRFELSNLTPGNYTLVVSYVGFSTFEKPITVTADKLTNADT